MIEYKVVENPEVTELMDKEIVKTGGEVKFTLRNVETDIQYLNKKKKEITAEIGIREATKKNIERTHPNIVKMTQEDLTAAYLFREATGFLSEAQKSLDRIEIGLKEYEEDLAEIEKQTGLKVEMKTNEKGENK
jgi:hypothetical protein